MGSSVAFPVASPVPARTLKKQVFAWRVCQFSHLARLRARPNNPENEMKKVSQKAKTRSEQRTRKEPEQTFKKSSFLEPQALQNRPQASPKQPRKRLEAAGDNSSEKSRSRTAPSRLQGLPSPSCGEMRLSPGGPRGLRVTGFAHPGPLGTDSYQRKAI